MGIFDDFRAIIDIQKIKKGETRKLSVSQITGVLVNLLEAKNRLNEEEFDKVNNLFEELKKDKNKTEMDFKDYLIQAINIIKLFDNIAPFELYCGIDDIEILDLMKDIRNNEI